MKIILVFIAIALAAVYGQNEEEEANDSWYIPLPEIPDGRYRESNDDYDGTEVVLEKREEIIETEAVFGEGEELKAVTEELNYREEEYYEEESDFEGLTFIVRDGSKSYYISKPDNATSFKGAIAACQENNMKIVTLETPEERDVLFKAYKSEMHGAYVGVVRGGNDTWQRIDDGSIIDFDLKFFYGEPNNLYGLENCLYMMHRRWTGSGMNDIQCIYDNSFLCVKKN